jgi:uncharacterized protein
MWSSGETVALRDIWFGEVWRAVPAAVVSDGPETTAVHIAPGSESVYPVDAEGKEIRLAVRGARRARRLVRRRSLVLLRPDAPWSIWHMYGENGSLDHWYVNFEHMLGRGPATLDYVDHKLDLIVRPDGSVTWKDEDELEEAGRLGLVDPDAVRRDAKRVLDERPWPTGWEEYRPDPAWPVPELPPGWDDV